MIDFLAQQGSLILSVLGVTGLIMTNYSAKLWQASMLDRLYKQSSKDRGQQAATAANKV